MLELAGFPQTDGSPQSPRLAQSCGFRSPFIKTPVFAPAEDMPKTNVPNPFATVPSTTAVTLKGGAKDCTLWIVNALQLSVIPAISIPSEEKVGSSGRIAVPVEEKQVPRSSSPKADPTGPLICHRPVSRAVSS